MEHSRGVVRSNMLLLLQQVPPSLVLSLHLRLPCSDWRRGMFVRTMCIAAHHASASENGCTTVTCRKQPHYCLRLRTDRGMLFVLALARPVMATDPVLNYMQVPPAITSWWYWCCSFFLVHPCFYSTSSCSGCTSGVPVHCDHRQLYLSAASVLFVDSVVSHAVIYLS